MEPRKQAIIDALRAFVDQRPGLQYCNYGDLTSYRSEAKRIQTDRRDYNALERAVLCRDEITAVRLLQASRDAFSGRLTIKDISARYADGSTYWRFGVDYCTGQYFPTEYRKAACAVLASALWYYVREHELPKHADPQDEHDKKNGIQTYGGTWQSAGDWLRAYFRREFGAHLARKYFD